MLPFRGDNGNGNEQFSRTLNERVFLPNAQETIASVGRSGKLSGAH